MRIFAGPNGSGKSTFINKISTEPPSPAFKLGYYVNADDLEQLLKKENTFNFDQFGCTVTTKKIQSYFKRSVFAPVRLNAHDLWENFSVENNRLFIKKQQVINSYIAADLAEFIRRELLRSGASFSYETVMSDKKKITYLRKAKKAGYRIYLYFFTTEDPLININRIKVRVAQHGHAVKKEVVEKRYYKSLQNLKAAVKLSDRAYLFDNSYKASILISEITDGKNVKLIAPQHVPNWFVKYIYENEK